MKRSVVRFAAVLAVSGAVLSSFAAAPVKVTESLNIENLAGEARDSVAELGKLAETAETLASAREDKSFDRVAGTLACLAQAIAEHEKGGETGIAAAGLRDASLALRKAKTLEEAQAGLASAAAALEGKASDAAVEHPWNKLVNMHRMMEEIENRQVKLRRSLARPRNLARDSRNADVLAVLGMAMIADTHEVKNPADLPQWDHWSREYVASVVKLSEALRAGKADDARTLLEASAQQCDVCHEKFQK